MPIVQLPPPQEIADTLREILAGPEFVTFVAPDSDPLLSRLIGFVLDALGDLIVWLRDFLGEDGSGLLQALAVLIPVLALVAAGVIIVRHRRAAIRRADEDGPAAEQLPTTAREWLGMASERARQGYFRSAATALYQGFLLTLDQRGTLAFHPSKTPGDYSREISGGYGAGTDPVTGRRFLNSFQGFSFGHESPTGDGYRALAELAREAGCTSEEKETEPESP